jgi:hypothetical protein
VALTREKPLEQMKSEEYIKSKHPYMPIKLISEETVVLDRAIAYQGLN